MTVSDSGSALAVWNDRGRRMQPELFAEKVWHDDDVTEDLRLIAETEPGEAVGFVVGAARSTVARGGSIKMMAVAPHARRRGVGTLLVDRVEHQFRRKNLTTIRLGESPPNYLQPGVDSDDEAGLSFFVRRGFVQFGTVYDMTCHLEDALLGTSSDEERLATNGILIRRGTSNDRAPTDTLLGMRWPAWKPEIEVAFRSHPLSVHVAVVDNLQAVRVVGFAAHSTNNTSIGWFGPMGTDPEFRGTGIGTVLLKRCLQDLRTAGFIEATIPWVGPVDFYTRSVGARVSRTYHRFEKKLD